MKTNEDIEAKIEELKAIGSPSALSKVKELEWVLGLTEDADEEADMLVDALLKDAPTPAQGLWEQVPEFARNQILFRFSDKGKPKPRPLPPAYPTAGSGPDALQKYRDDMTQFYKELEEAETAEREAKIGKSFRWKDILSPELFNATKKKLKKLKDEDAYDDGFYTKIPDEEASIERAELISSVTKDGMHRPLLDIDFPAVVIPSSTPGHGHLYIDKELTWKEYTKLLNLFADLGIIEHGYRGASLARGYTALRLPWIKKEQVEEDITQKF
jgi:hypothetical protein